MTNICRYTSDKAEAWDDFVRRSKQGTFLFERAYMDYHHDRFADHSLMVYRKGRLFALLPANEADDVLWSHQGLTYGGLLTGKEATVEDVCDVFRVLNDSLRQEGFGRVVYKAMPWIYHRLPAEEDLYALTNVCDARLVVRHISSTLVAGERLRFAESRRSGLRKARRQGIEVRESEDMEAFWNILNSNLKHKYGAHPVHTLAELLLLKARFPQQIRLFMAYHDDDPLGGTLVFETSQVVHTQYISASPEGKACGALDVLFDYLLNKVYPHVPFFDFGKSSNGDGHELNEPLVFQKEGFGGRGVCYDWYEYEL